MEWLLVSFVAITTVAIVNRFVIGILLEGHAILREGQGEALPDRRRPRFGWIMLRLPAVHMLEYQPHREAQVSGSARVRRGRLRSWWQALRGIDAI